MTCLFESPIFPVPENFIFKLCAVESFYLATHTVKFMTILTLFIRKNIVVVKVEIGTNRTLKGRDVLNKNMFVTLVARRDGQGFIRVIKLQVGIDQSLKLTCSGIGVVPYITKLRNRSKYRTFKFVDVMGKVIGTRDESTFLFVVDLQLNLTDNCIIKFNIDENVVSSSSQSIFHPYYFEFLRILNTCFNQLSVDHQYLVLLR